MGWQSDWLYQLIFDEVETVWGRAIKDGAGQFGPAPTAFIVSEMRDADWEEHPRCRGDAHRQWTFQGGKPETLDRAAGSQIDLGKRRGMFYERGGVWFCIDTDRRRVLFTYTLGPRYGRGMIFDVVGQGAKGKFRPGGRFVWCS
jgi:hypothetical protein